MVTGWSGSLVPDAPGSTTSAGVSRMPITRRHPAMAFCASVSTWVPICTGPTNSVTRNAKASTLPAVILAAPAGAEDVAKAGAGLGHAPAMLASVGRPSRAVSREFVKLFVDDVVKPFAAAGMPAERWGELAESIEHVRPLAADALLAVFRRTMDDEVEATFAELARRLAARRR